MFWIMYFGDNMYTIYLIFQVLFDFANLELFAQSNVRPILFLHVLVFFMPPSYYLKSRSVRRHWTTTLGSF